MGKRQRGEVIEELTEDGRTSGILAWLLTPPSILQKMLTDTRARSEGAGRHTKRIALDRGKRLA